MLNLNSRSLLTLENDSLRKVIEGMETQNKVLTEALQLQLEPQVLNPERISPRLGVRASSFGSLDSNCMIGISVANKVERSPTLIKEDFPETVRAPEMPSRARKRAALVESVPSVSGMVGEHSNFGGLRISISSSTDDGYAAEIEGGGLNAKKNRQEAKKSVLKLETRKAASKKDGENVEKILYDYWW